MISGSLRLRKTAAAQIAPTELPVLIIPAPECVPLCSKFSPCSMVEEERMRDMFVRPKNEKMDRQRFSISMPSSPEVLMHLALQSNFIGSNFIGSKITESPITAVKLKRMALLFD